MRGIASAGNPSFFSCEAGKFWEDMREALGPGRIMTSRPARATTGARCRFLGLLSGGDFHFLMGLEPIVITFRR